MVVISAPRCDGQTTVRQPEDDRRLQLQLLDLCLHSLEEAHERNQTVVSEQLAHQLRRTLPAILPGMLITESIELVFRAQHECLRGRSYFEVRAQTVMLAAAPPAGVAMGMRPAEALDESAARELTENIRSAMYQACTLLLEAHQGRAWLSLGYRTWEQYVKQEFGMSRSRSYEILDQGRVLRALQEAASLSSAPDLSTYATRQIKPHLDEIEATIRRRAAGIPEPEALEVVMEVVGEVRRRLSQDRPDELEASLADAEEASAALDRLFQSIEHLAEMPPVDDLLEQIPAGKLRRLSRLNQAARWLARFAEVLASSEASWSK